MTNLPIEEGARLTILNATFKDLAPAQGKRLWAELKRRNSDETREIEICVDEYAGPPAVGIHPCIEYQGLVRGSTTVLLFIEEDGHLVCRQVPQGFFVKPLASPELQRSA